MANAYLDLGFYSRAEAIFEKALDIDPGDLTALEGLAVSSIVRGDADKTWKVMEQVPDTTKTSLRYQLLRAELLIQSEQWDMALEHFDYLIAAHPDEAAKIADIRDNRIAGLPAGHRQRLLEALALEAENGGPKKVQYHILCLILSRRYQKAIDLLEKANIDPETVPDDRRYWLAWANFKTGKLDAAQEAFSMILRHDPGNLRARLGLVYCHASKKAFIPAMAAIEKLEAFFPNHTEVLFAKAFVFEKQERFWDAVAVYEHILKVSPGNRTAMRLRVRALSDMGATFLAENRARADYPKDEDLINTIARDAGVDRIQWEETADAVRRLKILAAKDSRYTFDYIAALSKEQRYAEVLEAYERVTMEGISPPVWAQEIAADAYLAEQKPYRALELYDQILEAEPYRYQARLGRFYVLQDLRRWEEAQVLLDALDTETADSVTDGGKRRPNPRKLELAVTRAWFLAYQDRLGDAANAFESLHKKVPANLDVRNGLAHIYMWRGWHRKALSTFAVLESMDASYKPAETGRIAILNELGKKRQARQMAALLLQKKPNDKGGRQVARALDVEQMNEWRTDISGQREDDDTYDMRIRTELSTPLGLKTRLSGYLLWQRIWQNSGRDSREDPASYRRFGIGIDHIFDADWRMNAALSANYDDGQDAGIMARIDYNPTDTWFFGASGDTVSTDIARRARTAGIDASKWGLDATWRQSEWRQADIAYSGSRFSDSNQRDEVSVGYQQNLWVRNDWRVRLYFNFYTVHNSKGDETIYYNPKDAWELSATVMTEQTVRNMYHRSFVHRIYAKAGNYKQNGYGNAFTGSLRYEQVHAFSDRQALQAGIGIGRSVYDGEAVNDVSFDMVYQWRF